MCIFAHNYVVISRGSGGYHYCGATMASGIPMVKLVCTNCGKEKIIEG